MNTKHTPGPWTHDCELGFRWGVIMESRDGGRRIADPRPSQRITHQDKRKSDVFVYNEEDIANARLIAAAPELLAALDKIHAAASRSIDFGDTETLRDFITQVAAASRAAIAEATGGAA